MRTASRLAWCLALAACTIERAPSGRPAGTRSEADSLTRVEQDSAQADEVRRALRTYYSRLSRRDWTEFTGSFWRGAIITTKWVPPGEHAQRLSVATVDEFVHQAPDGPGRLAVFEEAPVALDIRTYGDLAEAWVVYRARFGRTRDSVEVHYGVDAFHLMKHEGAWRIVSLTFVTETPDRPLGARRP